MVGSDFWEHEGFTDKERQLKLCMGKCLDNVESVDPELETRIALYRCPSGDINKAWLPAVRSGTRTATRVVGIPRGSIIYHSDKFFTASSLILAKIKKDMASYFMCPYDCPDKSAIMVLRK